MIARGRERGKSLGEEVEAAVAIQVGGEQQTRLTDPGVGEVGGPERAVAIAQEGHNASTRECPVLALEVSVRDEIELAVAVEIRGQKGVGIVGPEGGREGHAGWNVPSPRPVRTRMLMNEG